VHPGTAVSGLRGARDPRRRTFGKAVIAEFGIVREVSQTSVAFSPSGTTLAIADYNGNTYLWTIG
jgi:hypothetical protein